MAVLWLTLAAPRTASAASLTEVTNFGRNPSGLRMFMYVPDNVKPHPAILVAVHFCTGSGPVFFSGTEFAAQANLHGFIVIYPSATRSGGCFDVSTPQSLTHNGNSDPAGIVSMVQFVLTNFGADASRVFVSGASSGAMMTNVLLGDYPDVFKAGAAFMGVPFGCFATTDGSLWNTTCANGQSIKTAPQWGDLARGAFPGFTGPRPRMQLWHGTSDPTLFFPNLGEEIKQWTNVLGVSQTAVFTDHPQPSWTRTRYGGTGVDAPVEAISVQGAAHVLPLTGMAALAIQFFGLDRDPTGDAQAPVAPANLAVSSVTSSSAILGWSAATDNVGVTGYRIFEQQGSSPAVQIGTATTTSFTATGLAAATTYSFFIVAVDAAGNASAGSRALTVMTTSAGGGGGGGGGAPGGTATVTITNDWGTGACATLTVTNNTTAAITWQVTVTVQGSITNLWNGTFTQSGSSVTISGVSWNAVLQPGESSNSVGFCTQD